MVCYNKNMALGTLAISKERKTKLEAFDRVNHQSKVFSIDIPIGILFKRDLFL